MPLLLYGVTECVDRKPEVEQGVDGSKVQTTEVSDLRCFYSPTPRPPGSGRESALQFHRVTQAILTSADLIPFRFPTLMADEAELASAIREQAARYHEFLERIRGRVQMEARLYYAGAVREAPSGSGTEDLQARHEQYRKLESAAAALEQAAAGLIHGWRQTGSSDQVRCFALVAREAITLFQVAVGSTRIPSDIVARISGPWPPTAFFGEDQK